MADKSPEEFQLDRDRLEFEKEKFYADAPKRLEELEKLRDERRKLNLEAADLQVPYKERPAYKATVFQGVAVLVAVISAVISVGTVEKILQAYKAEQAAVIAKAEANQANENRDRANADRMTAENAKATALADKKLAEKERGDAVDEKNKADEDFQTLRKEIQPLQLQITDFKSQLQNERLKVALAPISEILASEPLDSKLLKDVLSVRSDPYGQEREAIVIAYALGIRGTIEDRLEVLSLLEQNEIHKAEPNLLQVQTYRNRMISLASPPQENVRSWNFLTNHLGADIAAPYICGAYEQMWPRGKKSRSPQFEASFRFIAEHFSTHAECMEALWDNSDPDFWPGTSLRGPGSYPESDLVCIAIHRCPSITLLFVAFRIGQLKELPNGLQRLSGGSNSLDSIEMWSKQNPLAVKVFNEKGLTQLRLCGKPIWMMLSIGQYVGDKDLAAVCPSIH